MNSGTIANNVSHNIGGGVTAYAGIFNMTGGIITGNSALEGGGVYVSRAFFEKTDGSATVAAAVFVRNLVLWFQD